MPRPKARRTVSSPPSPRRRRAAAFGRAIEALDPRRLLAGSAWTEGGTLVVNGDDHAHNTLRLEYLQAPKLYVAHVNGQQQSFHAPSVNKVELRGGDAGNKINVDPDALVRTVVYGGDGADMIVAGPWNDAVHAYGGGDYVYTGGGSDVVHAGTGDDWVNGDDGDDNLSGDAGDDTLDGGAGNDAVLGGAGADVAHRHDWSEGIETHRSGPAPQPGTNTGATTPTHPTNNPAVTGWTLVNNRLVVAGRWDQPNMVRVGYDAASDRLNVLVNGVGSSLAKASASGGIQLDGGSAADDLRVAADVHLRATIVGHGGDDVLWGGGWNDQLNGSAGDDTLTGGGGNDQLNGDDGDDDLDGGDDSDALNGGAGTDRAHRGEAHSSIELWGAGTNLPTGTGTNTGTNTGGNTGNPTAANGAPPVVYNSAAPVARITFVGDSTVKAGTQVTVDGLASTLNGGTFTTARLEWDFGDASGRYNKLVGFNASHLYETPGTYTLTLRVYNEAGKGHAVARTVTVTPDDRSTIWVAPWGNDANDGGSQGSPVRSADRAGDLAEYRSDVKVLFARGGTYDLGSQMLLRGDNVVVGAWGSGAKPTLRYNGPRVAYPYMIVFNTATTGNVLRDVTMTSVYTDTNGDATGMPNGIQMFGVRHAVANVTFLDVSTGVLGNMQPEGMLVQDSDAPKVTGVRGYFAWLQGSHWTLLGNTVVNSTREHAVRMRGADVVLFHDNDLANLDRRGQGDLYDMQKGALNIQTGQYIYASANTIRGPLGVGPLGEGDGLSDAGARTKHVVLDGNTTLNTGTTIRHGAEDVTVRNNVFSVNDGVGISVQRYNSQYGRGVRDVRFLNNTGLNQGQTGNFLSVGGDVDGLTWVNNLYVAPNLVTGSYGTAPVQVFDDNLHSFDELDSNVYEDPIELQWAEGGVNWLGVGNDAWVWRTPEEWNNLAGVGTDLFTDTTLDASLKPAGYEHAAHGGQTLAGVFTDVTGAYRPNAGWSVGAVQA